MRKLRQAIDDGKKPIGQGLSIGDRLRALRDAAGLSQQVLSDRTGYQKAQIGQWERGLRNPGVEPVRVLAEALGGSFVWLALGQGDPLGNAINGPLLEACVEFAMAATDADGAPALAADLFRRACAAGLATRHADRKDFAKEVRTLADA